MRFHPLSRDTFYNLLGNGVPLVIGVISIPQLLEVLGAGPFGILTLVWAVIGASGMLDLGVGKAMTYEVARARGISSAAERADTFGAGIILATGSGLLIATTVLFGLFISDSLASRFDIHKSVFDSALIWLAVSVLPSALLSLVRGVLEGESRFLAANVLRVVQGGVLFAAPVVCVLFGTTSLAVIMSVIALSRVLLLLALGWRFHPWLSNACHLRKHEEFKRILRFGSWITVSGFISPIMVYGDRFLIATVVGVKALPIYVIPQEIVQRLLIIPMSLSGALMPRASRFSDVTHTDEYYRRNLVRVALAMLPICLFAALVAPAILGGWISAQFAIDATGVFRVICLGLWFNSLAQIPLTFIYACGHPKSVALVHASELPLYILGMFLAVNYAGVAGAAVVWSTRVVLDFFLLHFAYKKIISRRATVHERNSELE
jgi:O-antigen/teichoic acid export membrane protein